MASTLNRQPLFTGTPILTALQAFDPPIATPVYNPSYQTIFQDNSSFGSLITRITVTAPVDFGGIVTEKVIYLFSLDENSGKYTLYASALMPGTSSAVVPPSVVFTFGNGLVTEPSSALGLAASTNYGVTNEYGDYVAVVIEGGRYEI